MRIVRPWVQAPAEFAAHIPAMGAVTGWPLPLSSPPEIIGPPLSCNFCLLLMVHVSHLEISMFSHLSLLKKFTLESRFHNFCLCLTPSPLPIPKDLIGLCKVSA